MAHSTKRLTDEELLDRIREAAERLGRSPKARECEGWLAATRRFGTWNAALAAAGLPQRTPFTRDYLLQCLRDKAAELGRTPTLSDLSADPSMPGHHSYYRRWPTYRDACKEAGLDTSNLQAASNTYANVRDHHLRRTYGITEADYERMHDAQGGMCAICAKPETEISNRNGKVKRLSVDHCHDGGHVRGLLCSRCNQTLGKAEDDADLLEAMAGYLRRHGQQQLRVVA